MKTCTKGGTKSDEMKQKAKQTIVGNKYEHRKPINEAIDKLKKTMGNEMVGPPHFKNVQPWMNKYEQVNSVMKEFGEKKNDPALVPGGFTDMKMKEIKENHLKKLKENKKEHKKLMKQVKQLPKPPKSVKKKLKVKLTKKGGAKKKRSKTGKKVKSKYHLPKGLLSSEESPHYHLPKGLLSSEESPHYHLPRGLLDGGAKRKKRSKTGKKVKSKYHLPKGLLSSEESPHYHLPKGLLSSEESPHYHLPKGLLDGGAKRKKRSKTGKKVKSKYHLPKGLLSSEESPHYHLPKGLLSSEESSHYHLPRGLLDGGKKNKQSSVSKMNDYYKHLLKN